MYIEEKTASLVARMRNLARFFSVFMFAIISLSQSGRVQNLDGALVLAIALATSSLLLLVHEEKRAPFIVRISSLLIVFIAIVDYRLVGIQSRTDLCLLAAGLFCLSMKKDFASYLAQVIALFIGICANLSIFFQSFGLNFPLAAFRYFLDIPLFNILTFACGAAGIFLAQPQTGVASLFVSPNAGGRLARFILLPICIIIPALGLAPYTDNMLSIMLVLNLALPFCIWMLAYLLDKEETHKVTIINSISSGLVVCDHSGRLSFFNHAARDILGMGPTTGTHGERAVTYGLFLPDRRTLCPADELPLVRAMRGQTTTSELFVCNKTCPQGKWIRVNGFPLRDNLGSIQGGAVIFNDISECKASAVRRSMQYSIADVISSDLPLEEAASSIVRILCQGMEWDYGTLWYLLPESANIKCLGLWHASNIDEKELSESSKKYDSVSGETQLAWLLATSTPSWSSALSDPAVPAMESSTSKKSTFLFPLLHQGNIRGFVELFRMGPDNAPFSPASGDLEMMYGLGSQLAQYIERRCAEEQVMELNTELQANVEELATANARAQEALHVKDTFIANISHELRTPLTGVLGMNELLLSTSLDEEQRDLAQVIQTAARALLSLVNEILDFARLEAGKLTIECSVFDLHSVINNVCRLVEPAARLKKLNLANDYGSNIPEQLCGDSLRCQQVLLNLLGNAIKFTLRGEIRLSTRLESDNGENVLIKFVVSDTGIGITREKSDLIFSPFTQCDDSSTRSYGGAGLGLTICQRIVELMGGRIGFQSEKGRGSTFWFTVPFKRVEIVSTDSPGLPVLRNNVRVLVVEDDPTLQKLVREQLKTLGFKFEVLSTAEEALVRLIEDSSFSLILMDCHLPHMDGLEATRIIRQREQSADRHTPIIALTASVLQPEIERCLSSGMDDCLTKPYTMMQFKHKLEYWLRSEFSSRSHMWKSPLFSQENMPEPWGNAEFE